MERTITSKVEKTSRAERPNDPNAWGRLTRRMLEHRDLKIAERMIKWERAKLPPETISETIFNKAAKILDKVVDEDLKKLVNNTARGNKRLPPEVVEERTKRLTEFVEKRVKGLIELGYCRFELPEMIEKEITEIIKNDRDARRGIKELVEENPRLKDSLKDIEDSLLKSGVKKWKVGELLLGELLLADLSLRNPLFGLNDFFEERRRELGVSRETLEKIRKEALPLIEKNASAKEMIDSRVRQNKALSERVNIMMGELKKKGVKAYEILPKIAEKLDLALSKGEPELFDLV